MDMNADAVSRIIGTHRRFTSPFEDCSAYYIADENTEITAGLEELYFDKLRYAANNAEALLSEAFSDELYNFYGVNKAKVNSPKEMLAGLVFESFVLVPERKTVECCVSNPKFMFGHFIELIWDYDWNLQSVWIN